MDPARLHRIVAMVVLLAAIGVTPLRAESGVSIAPAELARKTEWVQHHLSAENAAFFSFAYGGKTSGALLPRWEKQTKQTKLDDQRTEHELTWTDPRTGLVVRCRAVEYHDFPTVEWTLYLKNTGVEATPILEQIQALDLVLNRQSPGEFLLHSQTGDNCSAHSYEPHETRLNAGASQRFAPDGGRPTNGAYPYFNVAYDGGGVIAVIGWPGQWAARFERDAGTALRITAGQERTHFQLLPGEEVRSPLVVLQFWNGDRIRAQNLWRRWMVAHNLPRPGGKLPAPFTSACMGLHQSENSEIGYIDAYLKGGAKLDYWWMDAGWYPCRDWPETGTWEPDPARFPRGIRAVSDHAHARDMKLVLWFEPERVHAGSWLFENHPGWLLGAGGDRLLNLGDPDARHWLTDHVDKFLTEQGIDLYRQDFNIDPLDFWRGHDAENRQGITEIRHVEGYLAFWDELRRRHPDLLIDSCASGGRRNDLETLRRAVPLLRSDFQAPQNPDARDMLVGNQGHTYGLSFWVPYYGTGVFYNDVYAVRSHLTPAFGIGFSGDPNNVDWAAMRRRIEDWKQVADDFLGDYYPLTPYSLAERDWIAWQFDRPEAAAGMIQAFRRQGSEEESRSLKLRGLDAGAVYELRDLDRESGTRASGRALMETGLPVTLSHRPQAALIAYRRLTGLAAVVAGPLSECEVGEEVALSAKDSHAPAGEIASAHWELGDGTTAEGFAVTHAYKNPGTYTVKLSVRDRQGTADTTHYRHHGEARGHDPADDCCRGVGESGSCHRDLQRAGRTRQRRFPGELCDRRAGQSARGRARGRSEDGHAHHVAAFRGHDVYADGESRPRSRPDAARDRGGLPADLFVYRPVRLVAAGRRPGNHGPGFLGERAPRHAVRRRRRSEVDQRCARSGLELRRPGQRGRDRDVPAGSGHALLDHALGPSRVHAGRACRHPGQSWRAVRRPRPPARG